MRHKKKLLAAAILAVSVSSAVAAPQVLSEEELGDVSAQGIQVITNPTDISAQQNNNDSVQLNGISQQGAAGMQVVNNTNTAENVHSNLINLDSSSSMTMSQLNDQYAENHEIAEQYVYNYSSVDDQNNNNASVQINDDAQTGITAGIVSNVSGSAKNIAQNIANITNSSSIGLTQTNNQVALNEGSDYQEIYNGSVSTLQDNNNNSVQLNDNAQSGSNTMVLDNTASSAQNVAQNIIGVDGLIDSTLTQSNAQYAENVKDADQLIINDGDTALQNNNNASVQVNDNAQTASSGMVIKNTADSAQNIAQNIIDAQNMDGLNIMSQSNYQTAINGTTDFEMISQVVLNNDADLQDNNNASVQLNANAQAGTTSMVMENTANSGSNTGQNITSASGFVSVNIVESSNTQYAENYTRWDVDQSVVTGNSNLQRNNVNSVQLNDNAQNSTSGMVIANTAGSASNIGQNAGQSFQFIGFNVLLQSNEQYAYNGSGWSNWSFQDVSNTGGFEVTEFQDNNNASVQINNGTTAQEDVDAMALSNTAHAASNIGQNVAAAGNLFAGNEIGQANYQEADNMTWTDQGVLNAGIIDITIAQDNNNSSVQISSGQNRVNAMTMQSVADSATNTGQNVLEGFTLAGLQLGYQSNEQYAYNDSLATQEVNNLSLLVSAPIVQDNNNGSVQVDNTQENNNTMITANIAGSAGNLGQNVGYFASLAQIALLGQYNTQEAYNYYSGSYQTINNESWDLEVDVFQDNNNASVQVNGGQDNNNSMVLANIASSGSNIAQNVMGLADIEGLDLAEQVNNQYAYSYSEGDQDITNIGAFLAGVSIAQDNNNASVQLNGAQDNSTGMLIQNSAASATNSGQNIADVFNPIGFSYLNQSNVQEAYNEFYFDTQEITNDIAVAQDNNNGSIQLNGSQSNVSSMMTMNTALAAANSAMNIAYITGSDPFGTVLSQSNVQTAENDLGAMDSSQTVDNVVVIFGQDNNNGSVQLNNAQVGANGMAILNAANSGVNVGFNIANVTGASGTTITQTAVQSAVNF